MRVFTKKTEKKGNIVRVHVLLHTQDYMQLNDITCVIISCNGSITNLLDLILVSFSYQIIQLL